MDRPATTAWRCGRPPGAGGGAAAGRRHPGAAGRRRLSAAGGCHQLRRGHPPAPPQGPAEQAPGPAAGRAGAAGALAADLGGGTPLPAQPPGPDRAAAAPPAAWLSVERVRGAGLRRTGDDAAGVTPALAAGHRGGRAPGGHQRQPQRPAPGPHPGRGPGLACGSPGADCRWRVAA